MNIREQYATWKEDCKEMDHVVGSGRLITAPTITEDGDPIYDPLVLLEANPDNALPSTMHGDSNAENSDLSSRNSSGENASDGLSLSTSSGAERVKDPGNHVCLDKKVIQWKLTLHQIGTLSFLNK